MLVRTSAGAVELRALELGRDSLVLIGPWRLTPGTNVDLTMFLQGHVVEVYATVETSEGIGATAVTQLRLGSTTLVGARLLARTLGDARRRRRTRRTPQRLRHAS